MNIKIKTLTGKIINVTIQHDYSINEIKQHVQEMEGIDPNQMKILYNGEILDNDAKIKDYNINQHSTLHLVLALRGGKK